MSGPKRIQRRRTKGWKMPEGAVYVGRPTKWGNPFVVGTKHEWMVDSPREATRLYRDWMTHPERWALPMPPSLDELRGHNLVCWCPIGQFCHATVLLELANQAAS